VDRLFKSYNSEDTVLITASQDIYSNILTFSDLNVGDTRLRMTNNPLIVPMNQTLRFLITSNDVLHAFGVPELGIKLDAVPGRINAVSTLITKPGVYFGACYEICGVYHGFMPINIIALP
jgi:heme/copper-type cytochrome/quinol oxidase subunit 2